MYKRPQESGFALLISLIVVGVVLSVGIAILDLSIKQVRLSTNAKDSELAFHAANAGMECAQYWRREPATSIAMEIGGEITVSCFGEPDSTVFPNDGSPLVEPIVAHDGEAFQYEYSFTWGPVGEQRCTEVTTLVASSTLLSATGYMEVTNMQALIPGYPGEPDNNIMRCDQGERCTVLSVRGYNKPCSNIGQRGVVQREVLIQF